MRAIAIALIFVVSACASVTPATSSFGTRNQVRERNYEIGVERVVVVGDPIVRVRDYIENVRENPMMEASENFQLSGGVLNLNFYAGERLTIAGERQIDGVTYTIARKDGLYGVQIAPDGSIGAGVLNNISSAMPIVMVYRFTPSSPTARFTLVTDRQVTRTPTGMNYEIVFNGIDGQAMRFQYREYTTSDMARPAFFQELSYPRETQTLRFRTTAIDVLSIDAQQIRYVVRAD